MEYSCQMTFFNNHMTHLFHIEYQNYTMSNSPEFLKAAEDVKALTVRPTDQELLDLYKFFKQASVGDCNTTRPGMFDLKGKYKWDAWNSLKGQSKEEAEKKYVEFAKELIAKYSS